MRKPVSVSKKFHSTNGQFPKPCQNRNRFRHNKYALGLNSNPDCKDQNIAIELTGSNKGQSQFSVKKLFSLIKNSRQDSEGIAPLKIWQPKVRSKLILQISNFKRLSNSLPPPPPRQPPTPYHLTRFPPRSYRMAWMIMARLVATQYHLHYTASTSLCQKSLYLCLAS